MLRTRFVCARAKRRKQNDDRNAMISSTESGSRYEITSIIGIRTTTSLHHFANNVKHDEMEQEKSRRMIQQPNESSNNTKTASNHDAKHYHDFVITATFNSMHFDQYTTI